MNKDKIKFNEINIEENHLSSFLFKQDIYNPRKTKIKSKNNYLLLIQSIKNLEEIEFKNYLNYLNMVNIPILKIIINGFIEFNFDNEKENNTILEIISKIIEIYFNKSIFYFIYKKLSKYFRRHYKIIDIENIKKFEKLFKIWKLLYNFHMFNNDNKENDNSRGIIFSYDINNENKNIVIDFKKNLTKNNKSLSIKIEFFRSPILNLNKIIGNFSFLKLCDNNNNEFDFKYNLIFNENTFTKESFSKVNTISFELKDDLYEIHINDKKFTNKEKFNFNSIIKIELLNNFVGEVSKITLEKDNLIKIYINNTCNRVQLDIKYIKENDENKIDFKDLIQYEGKIFSDGYVNNSKNKILKKSNKTLKEIEYFGGFESFIPLFKIIKYIIIELGNIFHININDNEKENNKNYFIELMKAINWISDILKIIIQLIFLSKNNYLNFKNIIISLIGSLFEIYNIFKRFSLNKIPNLFNNIETIKDLFIIIVNSKVSWNIKNTYQKIFDINNKSLENYNCSMDYILFNENNKSVDLNWYFEMSFNFMLFILLYSNSRSNLPKPLLKQLEKIYSYIPINYENIDKEVAGEFIIGTKPFLNIIKGNKKFHQKFQNYYNLFNENNFYFSYMLKTIGTYLNAKRLLEINNIDYNKYKYIQRINMVLTKYSFDINYIKSNNEKENKIKDYFKIFINDFELIQKIFPFLKSEDFFDKNKHLKYELADYNGNYHHLIKELFIFNRLWSDQKLFYENLLVKRKQSNLKYKHINYYTTNFQRPIIYPTLDYKYRYPEFSKFKINKGFYNIDENKDDYNFDLDISESEKILFYYNNEIFNEIKNNKEIKNYNICLIKQEYHIKGNLFVFNEKKNLSILFYSVPEIFAENNNTIPNCNNSKQENNKNREKKNNLCNGATFNCPKKENNKKIIINLEDIRMIIKRIYYYRKSALEIFTETKSYYFNFHSEKDLNDFINSTKIFFEKSFFPIKINNNLNGYIRLNKNFLNKSNNNDFSSLICKMAFETSEICIFDLILLINLISNRSFIDLTQYPVFPLLHFYNKSNIIIEREMNQHIGFQDISDESKMRKNLFVEIFNDYKIFNDKEIIIEKNFNYFNTHYSNIVYTSNYMIRLFPYSFLAIELQGEGFDNPNRLFYSVTDSFNHISSQKSDLRELIPEFFYLPEMFINFNCLNFSKTSDNKLVDDVRMPKTILDKSLDLMDNDLKFFTFVYYMKKKLEKNKNNIISWIKLIFGEEQRYKLNKNGEIKEQYFRTESYIEIDELTYKKYLEDGITMDSVDFGLIPLKTISNKNISCLNNRSLTFKNLDNEIENILNNKIRRNASSKIISNKELLINDNNKNLKKNSKDINNIYEYKENKINKLFFNDDYKLEFKIVDNFQKLKIYENEKFKCSIIDHNDKIIDVFYNSRLNMFATTSYDSLACIYLFPKKLFSIIKHPKNQYFDKIYISANPFPTIITFEKQNNILSSYSLSGILIIQKKFTFNIQSDISLIFDINGGTSIIDKIKINLNGKEIKLSIPFFEED